MTWLTGNKKSFTLIEIMVTLSVLSVGLLSVYRSLFSLLDSTQYLSSRLQAQALVNNKIWEMEHNIKGEQQAKNFKWSINILSVQGAEVLNEIKLGLLWQERGRDAGIYRTAYVKK